MTHTVEIDGEEHTTDKSWPTAGDLLRLAGLSAKTHELLDKKGNPIYEAFGADPETDGPFTTQSKEEEGGGSVIDREEDELVSSSGKPRGGLSEVVPDEIDLEEFVRKAKASFHKGQKVAWYKKADPQGKGLIAIRKYGKPSNDFEIYVLGGKLNAQELIA